MPNFPAMLRWTSLALQLGYTAVFAERALPGDPPDRFVLRDIHVFETARGFRVARMGNDGVFVQQNTDGQEFFQSLRYALEAGAKRAREATDADLNPLLPHLRAVMRKIQGGEYSSGKNCYCDTAIKQALRAITDATGFKGDYLNAND